MSKAHSHYSTREKLAIARQFGLIPVEQIAKPLRRPAAAVQRQAYRLGLVNAYGDTERMEAVRTAVIRRLNGEPVVMPPKQVRRKPKPKQIDDDGRIVRVLPPTGPGYGPRIVHRIGL